MVCVIALFKEVAKLVRSQVEVEKMMISTYPVAENKKNRKRIINGEQNDCYTGHGSGMFVLTLTGAMIFSNRCNSCVILVLMRSAGEGH
jgi:hypothetical protein